MGNTEVAEAAVLVEAVEPVESAKFVEVVILLVLVVMAMLLVVDISLQANPPLLVDAARLLVETPAPTLLAKAAAFLSSWARC